MTRRRIAASLLAVVAAAAAGMSAGASADSSNLPSRGDQGFGWKIKTLPKADSYGEPSILTAHGLTVVDTFGPTVWTSANHGKSWTLSPASDVAKDGCPSGDADHTILADGAILADNLCLAGPTNLLYRSVDKGKTWKPAGAADAVPGEAGFDSDRQWLTADPTNPKIVYMSYHDIGGPNIWVAKSTDAGATWPQRVPVTAFTPTSFADAQGGNTTARLVLDPKGEGEMYVAYAYSDPVSSNTAAPTEPDFLLRKIGIAHSTDGGLTWTNTVAYDGTAAKARVGHPFTTMAVDPSGALYIAFSARYEPSKSTGLFMIRSLNHGKTWTPPLRVSAASNGSAVMPSIVAPFPGVVDIAYYATRAKDFDDKNGEWSVVFSQTRNGRAGRPTFRHSRVGGVSHLHDICLAGTLCAVTGGNRNLSDFLGLTVDGKGLAQLVWTEDAETRGSTVYAEQTRVPR